MCRVLVTGANGFVGQAVCADLVRRGARLTAAVRSARGAPRSTSAELIVGDLGERPDLQEALTSIDCVVHLAGRAHVMRDREADVEASFRHSNVQATRHVAEQAAAAGVRRVVFLSSVKVHGEETNGQPFRETDSPAPMDSYGRTKLEAEYALREVAAETALEVAVVRAPLVYGPGVKANFRTLMTAVANGIPLPLASVHNRRSLVNLWNLCDLIALCIEHVGAAGETFLAADDGDLSTPELARALGLALGRPACLFRVPPVMLRSAGRWLGRGAMVERLTGSLEVDNSKATRLLDWHPRVSTHEALARTASWYRECAGAGS